MRLGLGLGFLHRLITTVVAEAPPSVTKFLLQEDGDFLMLEEPIQLFTQAGDNLITQKLKKFQSLLCVIFLMTMFQLIQQRLFMD